MTSIHYASRMARRVPRIVLLSYPPAQSIFLHWQYRIHILSFCLNGSAIYHDRQGLNPLSALRAIVLIGPPFMQSETNSFHMLD